MSEEVKALFNSISPTYDFLNRLLSFRIDTGWRKKALAQVQFETHKPLRILDLCAGTLDLSRELLEKFPSAIVTAADFSVSMLAQGSPKISAPLKERIHIVAADALNLPFLDSSFDLILCGYGFRNLDSSQKGLIEMKRVLKKGGQLIILDFFRPSNFFSRLFHRTYGCYILPWIGSLVSKNRAAYEYLYQSIIRFISLAECREMLSQSGYEKVQTQELFFGVSSIISGNKL